MSTQCLLPADLYRFMTESGGPGTVCGLYLRLQTLPSFGQYSALEYAARFGQAWLTEIAFFFLILARRKPRIAAELCAGANVIAHPLVFFVVPFLGSILAFNVGTTLFTGQVVLFATKYLVLRRWTREPPWRVALTVLLADMASWWVGATLSL